MAKLIDTGRFLELLPNYPHIWNHKLPNHFKKAKQEFASLAAELGSTPDAVRKKYTSTRTYYVKLKQQYEKQIRSGASAEQVAMAKPPWPYYDSCRFLNDTLSTVATTSSLDPPPSSMDHLQGEEETTAESTDTPNLSEETVEPGPEVTAQSPPDSAAQPAPTQSPTPRKRRKTTKDTVVMQALAKATDSLAQVQDRMQARRQTDTLDHFGCTIAGMIRNLPVNKHSLAMSRIMTVIYELELEDDSSVLDTYRLEQL